MAVIVLDPGHGGTTKIGGSSPNNATGPTGLLEKVITLDIARRAHDLLAGMGHAVRMTRNTDVNLGLAQRAAVARNAKADAFVSIHFNGFNGVAQGTETWLDTVHSARSRSLAVAVQGRMLTATGLADRGVRSQPLGVLKPGSHAAVTACCLVEISFMDIAAEEARLKTTSYKDRVATALATGIADFLVMRAQETAAELPLARRLEDGFAILANEARTAGTSQGKRQTLAGP